MSTMFWKGRRLIVALQEFQSVFQEGPETLENMEDLEIMPWGAREIVPWGSGRHPWRLCQGVHGGHPLEIMPEGSWRTSSGHYARGVMEDILWKLCQRGHGGYPLEGYAMDDIGGEGWKFGRC